MQQSAITFRRAIDSDLPHVQQMVADLCLELGLPVNNSDCFQSVAMHWHNTAALCFVAVDKEPIGVAAFIVSPELYNYDINCAHEAFWYVKPSYRGRTGVKLIKYVEKHLKTDIIDFGITDARLKQLLLRSGYQELKTILRKQ